MPTCTATWASSSAAPDELESTDTQGNVANEVQIVGFSDDPAFTAGTFTLTFAGQTTAALVYNATDWDVQMALEDLSNIEPGDVSVYKIVDEAGDQQWEVTFQGALAAVNVSQLTIDAALVNNGLGAPDEIESTVTQGANDDEIQVAGISDASAFIGGTFSLTFDGETTGNLAYNASAAAVQAALEALSSIGAGNVSVAKIVNDADDQQWEVTFHGSLAATNVVQLMIDASAVSNGLNPATEIESTGTQGLSDNEIQVVGFSEGSAIVAGTFTLEFDGETTGNLAYNASAAAVQSALEALPNIGSGNVAVSKPADASDDQQWEVTFQGSLAGTDVVQLTIDASAVSNGLNPATEIESTSTQGATIDEVQTLTITGATGGTFLLVFGGQITVPLDYDSTAGEIETALEALSSIDAVNVSGSAGGPWTITFVGAHAGRNVPELVALDAALTKPCARAHRAKERLAAAVQNVV